LTRLTGAAGNATVNPMHVTRRTFLWILVLSAALGGCGGLATPTNLRPVPIDVTDGPVSTGPFCGLGPGGIDPTGPVKTRDEAIAAARTMSGIHPPFVVLEVRHGTADEVYHGAHPSFTDQASADAYRLKMQREAWAVEFTAGIATDCGPNPPIVGSQIEVVIDAATGDDVVSVWTQF